MSMDVLARDVGNETAVPVTIRVRNQAFLFAVVIAPESPAPQKQTQFQGHVESRQANHGIKADSRQVVDSESAFFNDPFNLGESDLGGVVIFQSAPRPKAKIIDCKHDPVEDGPAGRVERTVDEDVVTTVSARHVAAPDQNPDAP